VNYRLGVRRRQRPRELPADGDRLRLREPAAALLQALGQRLAFQVLHHQVEAARGRLADVEDLHHAGVVDGVDRARLVDEAAHHVLALGVLGQKELDRDTAVDAGLERFVDRAHPALADQPQYLIVPELAANHRRISS